MSALFRTGLLLMVFLLAWGVGSMLLSGIGWLMVLGYIITGALLLFVVWILLMVQEDRERGRR